MTCTSESFGVGADVWELGRGMCEWLALYWIGNACCGKCDVAPVCFRASTTTTN
jgi:hypothetical protein